MLKSYEYKGGKTNLNFLKENSYSVVDLSDCPETIFCNNRLNNLNIEKLILPKDMKILNINMLSRSIIKEIVFPKTIRHLGEGCLLSVYGLKEVDFTDTDLKHIGASAFSNCQDLEKVVLGKDVRISQYAFKKCINLKEINLEKATAIGHNAFGKCHSLEEITINGSLSDYVFERCDSLKEISFLENTKMIYDDSFCTVFNYCNDIKNIYIDKKIEEKTKEMIIEEFGHDKNIYDNYLDFLIGKGKTFKEINEKVQNLER